MPYSPSAVTFDATQYISIPALSCTDNGKFSISFWYKSPGSGGNVIYCTDDGSFYENNFFHLPFGTGADWQQGENSGSFLTQALTWTIPSIPTWHHILFSSDMSGVGRYQLVIDGIPVPASVITVGVDDSPFNPEFNGMPFYFGQNLNGPSLEADICDVWIAPGTSLLDGSYTIPQATIDLFRTGEGISGVPNDPSGFPAGGIVLFSGDSSTFATNQGSGGTATLTGSLADAADTPATQTIPSLSIVRVLSSGSSWTVTNDAHSVTAIHCIGGGQAGLQGTAAGQGSGGDGGDGASWAVVNNPGVSAGDSLAYQVGAGGTMGSEDGTDTWLKDAGSTTIVLAPGGGSATVAIGDDNKTGGTGGVITSVYDGITNYPSSAGYGGSSGGGAGGPDAVGGDGGDTNYTVSGLGGAGGGPADFNYPAPGQQWLTDGYTGVSIGFGGGRSLGTASGANGYNNPFGILDGTLGGGAGGSSGAISSGLPANTPSAQGGIGGLYAVWVDSLTGEQAGPGGGGGGGGGGNQRTDSGTPIHTNPGYGGAGGSYGGGGGGSGGVPLVGDPKFRSTGGDWESWSGDLGVPGDGGDGVIAVLYLTTGDISTAFSYTQIFGPWAQVSA